MTLRAAWQPLAARLHDLTLVLADPILRRTELGAVTVWVALKEPRNVQLEIYPSSRPKPRERVAIGKGKTIAVGEHLHIVAVTARLTSKLLASHAIYAYVG